MNFRCLLCLFLISIQCYAVPAYNKKIKIAVEDGYVYITLQGDENYKYGTTQDGYTVLQSSAGWFYAHKDSFGVVSCSNYKLKKSPDKETINFLNSVEKGVRPVIITDKPQRINSRAFSGTQKSIGKSSAIGSRKVLLILMQFADVRFTKSKEDFINLFNEEGYNHDGAIGSVYDFYKQASFGQLELRCDIAGPYTANHYMAYYGANTGNGSYDIRPKALFDEAIAKAANEFNLGDYDCNGDGYIDNVHIIYAGYGEEAGASSNAIWAHQMSFNPIIVNNILIDRYSCSPELRGNYGTGITRIGVLCHEIGHALGAMDYYDTDYQTEGYFKGTGEWDIMAEGSWNNDGISPADFNPYVKAYNFGWSDVTSLQNDTVINIASCNTKDNIYRIDTPVSGDFFLLENRRTNKLNTHIPGEGLLIYHIDPSIERKALTNTINSGFPQACYPVCASSSYKQPINNSTSYGDINSSGCPFPGDSKKTEFCETSKPAAVCSNGTSAGFIIKEIYEDNETIQLSYSCNKTNDNNEKEDENNEENYDNIIWKESFETTPLSLFWTQEGIEGNSKWSTIIEYSTNGNNFAADGKGYAIFEASTIQPVFINRIRGKLISGSIELPSEDKYILNLYYCRKAITEITDTLSVYIREDSNDEWEEVACCTIGTNEKWEKIQVNIPDTYTKTEIALEGNINLNNTIHIDAISICRKDNETTEIKKVDKNNKSFSILYDAINCITLCNHTNNLLKIRVISANGTYKTETLNAKERKTLFLEKGLYIVCDEQIAYKAFIR